MYINDVYVKNKVIKMYITDQEPKIDKKRGMKWMQGATRGNRN